MTTPEELDELMARAMSKATGMPWQTYLPEVHQVRHALSAAGVVLVPEQITGEMIAKAHECDFPVVTDIWNACLSASPFKEVK